jgi:hypothetical protein
MSQAADQRDQDAARFAAECLRDDVTFASVEHLAGSLADHAAISGTERQLLDAAKRLARQHPDLIDAASGDYGRLAF